MSNRNLSAIAIGKQDKYLMENPQITFHKIKTGIGNGRGKIINNGYSQKYQKICEDIKSDFSINYIYLDEDERHRYYQNNNKYLRDLLEELENNEHILSPDCCCDKCKDVEIMVEI